MTDVVSLPHPSGAGAAIALRLPDGTWRIAFAAAGREIGRLGGPPWHHHAERSDDALLLVGEDAGTHYSLAVTATATGFACEFAERWSDRAAGRGVAVAWSEGLAGLRWTLPAGCAWFFATHALRGQPPVADRRIAFRADWAPN